MGKPQGYRQKIEIQLERKQLYGLVLGSAAAAALVFAVGIFVGKRAQAGAHKQAASDHGPYLASLKPVETDCAPSDVPKQEPANADDSNAAGQAAPEEAMAPAPLEIPDKPQSSGEFTLQISSFQNREEAVDFYKEIKAAGYEPYIILSAVPGRGNWYRVRLGAYKDYDAAIVAKQKFEQDRKIIAYVTRMAASKPKS